jgi:hypothetical protein
MAGFGMSSFDRAPQSGLPPEAPARVVGPLILGKYEILGPMEAAMTLSLRAGGYAVKADAPIHRQVGSSVAYVLIDATDHIQPRFFAVPISVALRAGLVTQAAFDATEARNTAENRAKDVASARAGVQKGGADGHPQQTLVSDLAGGVGSFMGSAIGFVGGVFGEGVKGAMLSAGPVPILVGVGAVAVVAWVALR